MRLNNRSRIESNGHIHPLYNNTMESPGSTLSETNIINLTSTDCAPPRKRPKRLSVSCVERDIQDSFIPFGTNDASIINVHVVSLSDNNSDVLHELDCICDDTSKIYRLRLEGIWSSTPITIGSSLRIISAKMEGEKELLLNWENGILIVERNVLVPCTLIAQGTSCRRKRTSQYKKEMLVGNVVHELFQTAITRSGFDVDDNSLLDLWRKELYEQYAEQLFALNLSSQEVEDELSLYFKTIIRWVSSYMPEPKGRNECLQIDSRIKEVVDVEESIWNSCYGFKAKIDCTLKEILLFRITDGKKGGKQKLVPVELKTGKSNPNTEHVTQVMLYCLALASKQGAIESGLLFYLLDATLRTVSPKMIDLKGVLHVRNEIAAGINAISFDSLPEPILDAHICKWCNQALSCSLLQHCSGSTITEIFFQDQIKHLKQNHIDYFKRFIRWLLMEWRYVTERNPADKENIYRRKNSVSNVKRKAIDEQCELFMKGDLLLILSDANEMISIASVISVKANFIDVAVSGNSSLFIIGTTTDILKNEKEDIVGISEIVRQLNCEQARAVVKSLMSNDYAIIEGFPGSGKTSTLVVLIRCLIYLGRTVLVTSHTHSAIDNLLLKLIEHIDENKILRLGQQTSVNKNLQHLTLEAKLSNHEGIAKTSLMQNILEKTPIVACTCLGISTNLLFSHRRFSMTVVDEASLVLESTILPAIAASDSFILVGDHRQLSPLVCSKQAREEGLAKSLLERLTVHHSAVITLHSQYRMNRPIAELSSLLFYENKLRCANNLVAEAILTNISSDPISDDIHFKAHKLCISTSLNNAVVFVDTQSYKNPLFCATFDNFGEVTNNGEAKFIGDLCKLFIKLGLSESDLGVISVYRYHVERLRRIVQAGIEFCVDREAENRKSELLADCRRINVAITRAKHKLILIGCQKSLSSYPAVNAMINAIPEKCFTRLNE
ncbi:BMA-DNA-2 [Dirofilaria immitis]|nr:BMA-DNA-2 [Dirofilaria immitis]